MRERSMRERSTTITLDRFLVEQQRKFPQATGRFTRFMGQVGIAAKVISNQMRRASLDGLLGKTGETNVQGEEVKPLDRLGNEVFVEAFEYVDIVGMLVSEEMSEAKPLASGNLQSGYAVMIDPIDGSSNLDVNGVIGSIFAVHDIVQDESVEASCLQRGSEQIAAGYVMYGSSTVLVYTAGHGVHSFVLDETIGEFVLERQDIKMPRKGNVFSANLGNYHLWNDGARHFTDEMMKPDNGPYSLRYSGSLLADLHAILSRGGIYYYPEDRHHPEGKLRLLYECAPLAMIAEGAGGAATSGRGRIMDIDPEGIHQRTPFAVGSQHEVSRYETAYRQARDT